MEEKEAREPYYKLRRRVGFVNEGQRPVTAEGTWLWKLRRIGIENNYCRVKKHVSPSKGL